MVTTATESAANNFNLDQQHPHAFRYRRAAEHVEVVKKLWDSFEDDAFVRDKEIGRFFDRPQGQASLSRLLKKSALDLFCGT